jgi:hypothetical protein
MPPDSRPLKLAAQRLRQMRSYQLAGEWMSHMRWQRRWRRFEDVWIIRRTFRKRSIRREKLWSEIFYRFDTVFRSVLAASGFAETSEALTLCVFRVHDLVNANRRNGCLPELMWRACRSAKVPPESSDSLEALFHLRAQLDEMPASDERAAIRFFVFPATEERAGRKQRSESIEDVYGTQQRQSVEIGLKMFAEHLHRERSTVEEQTAGFIVASRLATVNDAFDFIVHSFSHSLRRIGESQNDYGE